MRQTFMRQTFMRQTFMRQTFMRQTFMRQTFMRQAFMRQAFMRQTFMRQANTPRSGFGSNRRIQMLGDGFGAPPAHSRLGSAFLSVLCAIGGLCLVLLLLHGTLR